MLAERPLSTCNVQSCVDQQALRTIHWQILGLCALIMFVDAFDIFVVGKVAPAIASGFGAKVSAMTDVFLDQQIGLAVGILVTTPLADRYGRQRMLVLCSLVFGVITLLTPLARTLNELGYLRGISGIFLSGLLPLAVTLIAETVPRKQRNAFIVVSIAGYSAGSAAGGIVAAWFIDLWGWPAAFWIGGTLPLLVLPWLVWVLPESPLFLAVSGASPARIRAVLRRLDPTLSIDPAASFVTGDGANPAARAHVTALFVTGRVKPTIILWIASFLSMGSIAMLASWLPAFFQSMGGIPIQRFAVVAFAGLPGSLAGILSSGWLLSRVSAHRLIPVMYLGLAATIFALGCEPFGTGLFTVLVAGWNFFQSGGQAMINVLTTQVYPASIRGTGMGWAGGMGRTGGIVAPLLGGHALSAGMTLGPTLALAALLPLGVAIAVAAMRQGPTAQVAASPVVTSD